MDILDGYILKARLFPAILAVFPAVILAIVYLTSSLNSFGLPEVLISVALAVLFFALSDLARRFGILVEKKLFARHGGRPFPTVLRHADTQIDAKSKARYHQFLADRLGERHPSPLVESKTPNKADEFYIRCGNWLRENTRDQTKFHLLLSENISYGFRRNLYGLKWVGLGLNAVTVALCVFFMKQPNGHEVSQYGAVLALSILHAVYFLFGVNQKSVLDASDQYARQLVLSCELLIREIKET